MNLKFRFAFSLSLIAILVVLPFVIIVASFVNELQMKEVDNEILAISEQVETQIQFKIEQTAQLATTLSHTFISLKKQKIAYPHSMSNILNNNIINRPNLFGIWSVWEPYCTDTEPDSVPLKNYSPYWNRANKEIEYETLSDFNDPVLGKYYLYPKQQQQVVILPPTSYLIMKKEFVLSSVVAPIMLDNDFQGVVGVDFNYDFFQDIITTVMSKTTFTFAIYNSSGLIMAHTDRSKIGKSVEIDEKTFFNDSITYFSNPNSNFKSLKTEGFSKETKEDIIEYIHPVKVNNSDNVFYILISDKKEKLYADKTMFNLKIAIFIGIVFLLFLMIVFIYGNVFLKPLNAAVEYIMDIANQTNEYEVKQKYLNLKDERGLLFDSITYMHKSLLQKEENRTKETQKAEWIKDGQNKLYDSMQGLFSVKDMSENILIFICKYLDVQIGAIYLHYEKTKYLKLAASYSLTIDDTVPNFINIGEGLVGQAALDKRIISVSDVDGEYFYSSSSTLKILPKYLIILPFIMNNKVIGVIELGSYEEIKGKKITFLENILDNIAIAINSVLITKKILKRRRTRK